MGLILKYFERELPIWNLVRMNETDRICTAENAILATSALDRNTPRTCTPENASLAISGDNLIPQSTFVADLAIDPVTKQVDFSHSVPIESDLANMDQVKENMQQLLDMIMSFFEMEQQKVASGELKEEKQLLSPYVQEDDTSTQCPPRSLPAGFKRRRA